MSKIAPGTQLRGIKTTYVVGALVAAGGEGTVYRSGVLDAVKIYHHPPDTTQQKKLAAIVQLNRPSLAAVSAWPHDIVFGQRGPVGYVMPMVLGAVPIHTFFTPADRLRYAPHATYANQVALAANLARALITFHQADIVVGDLNARNVLAIRDGTVRLIDCDSYQVRGFPCLVGMEDFLAPELQGVQLPNVKRSKSHDTFALAVMIFHLLVVGRHPFAGSDAQTLGVAIKNNHYMLRRRWRQTDPLTRLGLPPSALFTPAIASLFERAFCGGSLTSRPSALDWMNALEDLLGTLKDCPRNASHRFAPSAKACPWCALERAGQAPLFRPTDRLRLHEEYVGVFRYMLRRLVFLGRD